MGEMLSSAKMTGLKSFDRATWSDASPRVSHVVPVTDGLGLLVQRAPHGGFPKGNETLVPALDDHTIQVRPKGARQLTFALEDARFESRCAPNSAIFIPAGVRSWWLSESPAADYVVHLHVSAFALAETARAMREEVVLTPVARGLPDPALAALVAMIMEEAGERGEPQRLAWQSYSTLVQLWLLRSSGLPFTQAGALAPWQAKRAVEFLEEHFDQHVELATLANLCDLSSFHFARAFKRSLGVPPHQYQLRLRLERAKMLLLETDLGVLDVALEVGYETAQPLCRLFKKEMGISPAQYRRTRRTCTGSP